MEASDGQIIAFHSLDKLSLVKPGCSSPIVVKVSRGLKPSGDWVNGSGDVPQDELGPITELDEDEGEPVFAPLRLNCAESRLDLEPLLLFAPSKRPERLKGSESLTDVNESFVCCLSEF